MGRVKRIWYLSPMRAAKVQASLSIRAVSPEPPLLAHTSSESRGTFRQKARSLAPLNDWACAVKICHDGRLEDTNSLDAAQWSYIYATYLCTILIVSLTAPAFSLVMFPAPCIFTKGVGRTRRFQVSLVSMLEQRTTEKHTLNRVFKVSKTGSLFTVFPTKSTPFHYVLINSIFFKTVKNICYSSRMVVILPLITAFIYQI